MLPDTNHQLPVTPAQVEGPFYPVCYRPHECNHLWEETDDNATAHTITIAGQLRNTTGTAIKNARIEIWQADQHGRYNHPKDHNHPHPIDEHFQYWGQCITNDDGCYTFTTIKPGPYNDQGDWRTPHIHFKVYPTRNQCALTTQMYFTGEALNNQDHHLNQLPAEQQKRLLAKVGIQGASYGINPNQAIHEFHITIETSA